MFVECDLLPTFEERKGVEGEALRRFDKTTSYGKRER
jgi:hypothetical protein